MFEVLSTSGDTHLGGDDFDKRIVDWLAGDFQKAEGIDLRKDRQALQVGCWLAGGSLGAAAAASGGQLGFAGVHRCMPLPATAFGCVAWGVPFMLLAVQACWRVPEDCASQTQPDPSSSPSSPACLPAALPACSA